MAWIRYKHWQVDGIPAHKAIQGAREYVFLDADQGLCDVRDQAGIEYLLARPVNYELAYERYGVAFGPDGKELVTTVGSPAEEEPPSTPKSKPHRPRKG